MKAAVSVAAALSMLILPSVQAESLGVHAQHQEAFGQAPFVGQASAIVPPNGRQAAITANREVVGYFPYWSDPAYVPYESLTRISWFNLEVDGDSNIIDNHGWGGSTAQSVVDTAHGYGIEVLVTVAIFNDDYICEIVNSNAGRTAFINMAAEQVNLGDADGISIDFETTPASCMTGFETFIAQLSDSFHQQGWIVDIASPAVDWSWGFDYEYLASTADSLFIMGYDYHWKAGNPGPVDPLDTADYWGPYCLVWTIEDYLAQASSQRDNIILGLPIYGYNWPSSSQSVPASAEGTASSVVWYEAQSEAAIHGRKWDTATSTPYYTYLSSGQAYQTWYQDLPSMQARFDYAGAQNIGGIGFWALGYDRNDAELWAAVDEYSGQSTTGPVTELVGYVRDSDIQTGAGIVGATLTLQNGESVQSDDSGYYRFPSISGDVEYTVTAEAACYESGTGVKYAESGVVNWNSIALVPIPDCDVSSGCSAPGTLTIQSSTVAGSAPFSVPMGAFALLLVALRFRRES